MSGFLNKSTDTISSIARNASCSRGWLRLVVQTIFFAITVSSFIMILLMVMKPPRQPPKHRRCEAYHCLVQCYDAPYYGKYANDIFEALKDTEAVCSRPSLTLYNPHFINGSLPAYWFTDVRFPVITFSVVGGNLKYLPSNVFMGQYAGSIETLIFQDITIDTWESNSLVGLSNLKELNIISSQINKIEKDAVRPVDDVLQTLTVIKCGSWLPDHLTGTSVSLNLKTVVMNSNNFSNILNKKSFLGLKYCEILFLNSCKINAIGEGTFDNLINLHVLYLNDNELITVPDGLFNGLRGPKDHLSRINLQGNPWMCDCNFEDFKFLSAEEMLLVEPSCFYPENIRDMLFSEFQELHCSNCSKTEVLFSDKGNKKKIMSLKSVDAHDDDYLVRRYAPNSSSIIPPVRNCNIDAGALRKLTFELRNIESDSFLENVWLQPTFLMNSDMYYLIEIDLLVSRNFGLMWYQASCPSEVNCIRILPNHLKIYNTNISSWYVFCPWDLKSGSVDEYKCTMYDLSKIFDANRKIRNIWIPNILFYISAGLACLLAGAFLVYIAIRLNPGLLKGSKRLLFVKYKEVNALVLPPKVPLRSTLSDNVTFKNNIFLLPSNTILKKSNLNRSMRSNSSYAPSYISVIPPSDDQLMKWRTHYFLEKSNTFEEISQSSIFGENSLPYCNDDSRTSDIS